MAIERFGKADIENIRVFENQYNLRLPNDYIDFLLQYNGGIIVKDGNCQVFVKSLKETIHVDVLYGIGTTHDNANIDTWMAIFKNDMLEGSVIIGDSIEHGFIVLMCSGSDIGICYWDHSYGFPCSNDESNIYFIAGSFTDFSKNII